MEPGATGLRVDALDVLRQRRSAKWQTYPADVLPLQRSDTGYGHAAPDLGRPVAKFAVGRWNWDVDSAQVTAVTDVGVGVVELIRTLTRPGDTVAISPPVYPPFFDWVPEGAPGCWRCPWPTARTGGASTWTRLSGPSPPTRPPTYCAIRTIRSAGCTPPPSWPPWPGRPVSTGSR